MAGWVSRSAALLLGTLWVSGAAACGDDSVRPGFTSFGPGTDSGTDDSQGSTTADSTTASSISASATAPDSDTENEDVTGDPPEVTPGRSAAELVGAGEQSRSSNYGMVHTLGQSSPAQGVHQSANYRLEGGLIGANGRPPQ